MSIVLAPSYFIFIYQKVSEAPWKKDMIAILDLDLPSALLFLLMLEHRDASEAMSIS